MMKKQLFLLLLAAVSILPLHAYTFEADGIYYLLSNDGVCSVTYRENTGNSYSGDVIIPSSVSYNGQEYSVTKIDRYAFFKSVGLTSVTIPNSVTNIHINAFDNCTGLTSISIPNSVTSIDKQAFYNCTGLTSLTIPNSVTLIDYEAFAWCTGLTSLTILPNCTTTIENRAFYNCVNLKRINIPDIETWCNMKFGGTDGNPLYYAHSLFLNDEEITDMVIPNSVTAIGNKMFARYSALTSVTIPNSVTAIGDDAFNECTGLTSITIPNSVTAIGEYAFYRCSSLTSVDISTSITKISDGTFRDCSHLSYINIPSSVTEICNSAFSNCNCITSITIPNSVKKIGKEAFKLYGLKKLKVDAQIPPEAESETFSKDIFSQKGVYSTATLYVPKESLELYKTTEPWSNFLNIDTSDNYKSDEDGINEVEADADGRIAVYNLSGVKIADSLDGLPKGIYIVRHGKQISKIAI